jgi:hypothetical protein
MSWNSDQYVDFDELGSLIRLFPKENPVTDIRLYVTTPRGGPIRTDGIGRFGDTSCLSARGYLWKGQTTSSSSKVITSSFWVIREVDSVSGSFSSFLKISTTPVKKGNGGSVVFEVHKAGANLDLVGLLRPPPLIKFTLKTAMLAYQAFVTCSETGAPLEILGFSSAFISIETAEQKTDGQMGNVRTCDFDDFEK